MPTTFVNQAMSMTGLTVPPIEVRYAAALTALAFQHREPFDAMFVVQALVENVPLLSADAVFDVYPVNRLR